jgi:hypothetical protein
MFCSDEQRAVVLSDDQYILLNGCAGSRKTDTLVRVCVRHHAAGRNVLIITLVGSVTNELRERLESSLPGCAFTKIGNHYMYEPEGAACIEIANYDAMLHTQLAQHRDPVLMTYGACFTRKANVLLDKYVSTGQHRAFVMRNKRTADVLLMDEFQDLPPSKARILTGVLLAHGGMHAMAAGDRVQSIFDHTFVEGQPHPMDIWRADLGAACFGMTKCFRCPRAHVRLVNRLLAPYGKDFELPPMEAASEDDFHRPLLFACPSENSNHTAHAIARQVCGVLAELRAGPEPDLHPEDVAVIMPRSNHNPVYHQLVTRLEHLYASWGHGPDGTVALFETRGDNFVRPIDWNLARGRTVLLSVHGDKGKGHKIVFFLGLSEGVVPSAGRLYTERELVDVSLLNVGLTRSTRWLFVGVSKDRPSRYVRAAALAGDLHEHCALAWRPDLEETGGLYSKLIIACMRPFEHLPEFSGEPWFGYPRYVTHRVNAPTRLMAKVRDDVSTLYEHPSEVVPGYPWRDVEVTKFGKSVVIPLPEERLAMYGVMGELIFQREYCIRRKRMDILREDLGFLLDRSAVFYTYNTRILNIVRDSNFNRVIATLPATPFAVHVDNILERHKKTLAPAAISELQSLRALKRPVRVVPSFLARASVATDMKAFLSDTPSRDLPPRAHWNAALAFSALYDPIAMHGVAKWLGNFDFDISELVANAGALYEALGDRTQHLRFHTPYKETLEDMGVFDDSARLGICGQSDFETDKAVFEVKCPRPSGGTSNVTSSWVIQALLYACLDTDRCVSEISVVDLTNGVWYRYPDMDSVHRAVIVRDVLKRLKHRDEHVRALMAVLRGPQKRIALQSPSALTT